MTLKAKTCLNMLRSQILEHNPAPQNQLHPSILFGINAGYSAGRLDAIGDVARLWRKSIENLDIAELVLNPSLFIQMLQALSDEYAQEPNLLEDLYGVKNGDEPGATEEAPKIIVG